MSDEHEEQTEDMDMLTDEERKALAEGDDDATQASEESAENTGDESADGEDSGDEESATAEETGETDEEADETDDQEEEQAEEQAAEAKPSIDTGAKAPSYVTDSTEGMDDKLATLDKQFNEGDIEMTDYLKQRDEIRDAIRDERLIASINEQNQANQWEHDQRMFLSESPEFNNPVMAGALQGVYSQPDFLKEHGEKSGLAILREAAKVVSETMNFTPEPQKETAKVPTKAEKKDALKGRGKRPDMPADIGGMPAASQDQETGGKYSSLDNLDGMELEDALAKMSESERDEYLRVH